MLLAVLLVSSSKITVKCFISRISGYNSFVQETFESNVWQTFYRLHIRPSFIRLFHDLL